MSSGRLTSPPRGHNLFVKISERLLSLLCIAPARVSTSSGAPADPESALDLLNRVFPGFEREIEGKDVLDFGCGAGLQSVAMARCGARSVLGLDTNARTLEKARALASELGLDGRVRFADELSSTLGQAQDAQRSQNDGFFDIVVSQNSMEHFSEPDLVLEAMKSRLRPGGAIFVTFGPPWFAPYGSHMQFFTKVPWVNLLFPESAVMKVRSRYVNDGAMRYEEVESGLNRMTVAKFERLARQCGLEMSHVRYDCIKGLDFLARVPVIRELSINHVSCTLRRASPTSSSDPECVCP